MKITKLGHCCLLIQEKGLTILTDPGAWTTAQNEVTDIHVILITHEHPDHFHVESVQAVLRNNPAAIVLTNRGVGSLMKKMKLEHELLEHGQQKTVQGISLEGHGQDHALIYPGVAAVTNTGYMIADRFFYPGDAFYNPQKPIEILALPVAGPWMKIAEAIDYAKALKPKIAFPVHDGMLKIFTTAHMHPARFLPEAGIQFDVIEPGDSRELS